MLRDRARRRLCCGVNYVVRTYIPISILHHKPHALGHDSEILTAFFPAAAIPTGFLGRVVLQGAAMRTYGTGGPAGGLRAGFLTLFLENIS